jgi:hypothetical protein
MDPHDLVIDTLTTTTGELLGELGVSKLELLAALVDFTAAVALIVGGEKGLEASIQRMATCLQEWRAGVFPAPSGFSTLIQ